MVIGDSESDSFKFESTLIWVMCFYDIEKQKFSFSFDESIDPVKVAANLPKWSLCYPSHKEHLDYVKNHTICMHNWFQHDKPLIKKFYPDFQPKEEHDSYILSQLFNPDRGKHGLDAWAKRLRGEQAGKVVHEEWDKFSPAMLKRVIDDVRVNVLVWEALQKEKKEWEEQGGSWDEAIKIEYATADLMGRQEMRGVLLDEEKAYGLADEILLEIQTIDEYLLEQMPNRVVRPKEAGYEKEPFNRDGSLNSNVRKWFDLG